jgi:hypothetical protein
MKVARLFAVMLVVAATGALAWAGPAAATTPIAGKVTNQTAQPLAGIKVCAVVFAPYRETCAQTDVASGYSIPGTGPGYKVHFYDPDGIAPSRAPQWYPGVPRPEEGEVVTEAEITAGIDAVMTPGAEVSGTVVGSSLGGAPLAGIKVCPDPTTVPAGEVAICDETGANGRFVLSDLGAGAYTLVFEPGDGINYQPKAFTTPPLSSGLAVEAEIPLKRGVEFEGHLTDGTTGLAVEPFGVPGSTPTVCALESWSEEVVKCVPVGAGGEYALAGLSPGSYVLVFGMNVKEDGVVVSSDGYVRQYYNDKSNFEEALVFLIEAGAVRTGTDATLVRGEEIWPEEEEAPWEVISEESINPVGIGGGETIFTPNQFVGVPAPTPPPLATPPHGSGRPKIACKKGFHRVTKSGQSRCVKIKTKPKKHRPVKHHAKKAAHR